MDQRQLLRIWMTQAPDFITNRLVRKVGLEPTHLAMPEPKSGASTNSATLARGAILGLTPAQVYRLRPVKAIQVWSHVVSVVV